MLTCPVGQHPLTTLIRTWGTKSLDEMGRVYPRYSCCFFLCSKCFFGETWHTFECLIETTLRTSGREATPLKTITVTIPVNLDRLSHPTNGVTKVPLVDS